MSDDESLVSPAIRFEHFKLYTLETKFSDIEQFKQAFKLDLSCDDGSE